MKNYIVRITVSYDVAVESVGDEEAAMELAGDELSLPSSSFFESEAREVKTDWETEKENADARCLP